MTNRDLTAAAMAELSREVDRAKHEHDLACAAARLRDENETLRWRLQWAASDLLMLLDTGRIGPVERDSPYLAVLREVVTESREFDARCAHGEAI